MKYFAFDLNKRDGYSLNFYKTDVNAWSDHVPFIGAKGNVMILCDEDQRLTMKKSTMLRLPILAKSLRKKVQRLLHQHL